MPDLYHCVRWNNTVCVSLTVMQPEQPRGILLQIKFQRGVKWLLKKSNPIKFPFLVMYLKLHANTMKMQKNTRCRLGDMWLLVFYDRPWACLSGMTLNLKSKEAIWFSRVAFDLKKVIIFCVMYCKPKAYLPTWYNTKTLFLWQFPHAASRFFILKQQFKFFNPGEKQGRRVGPVTLSSCEPVDAPDQGWDWIEIQHATHCVQLWCYSRRVGAEVKVRRDEEGGRTIMFRLEGGGRGGKRTHRMQLLRLVKPDSEEIEKRQWKHVDRRLKTRRREGRAGWRENHSFRSEKARKKQHCRQKLHSYIFFPLSEPLLRFDISYMWLRLNSPLYISYLLRRIWHSLTTCSKWSKL